MFCIYLLSVSPPLLLFRAQIMPSLSQNLFLRALETDQLDHGREQDKLENNKKTKRASDKVANNKKAAKALVNALHSYLALREFTQTQIQIDGNICPHSPTQQINIDRNTFSIPKQIIASLVWISKRVWGYLLLGLTPGLPPKLGQFTDSVRIYRPRLGKSWPQCAPSNKWHQLSKGYLITRRTPTENLRNSWIL